MTKFHKLSKISKDCEKMFGLTIFDFLLNSINIHVCNLELNFQTLIRNVSILITQKLQKKREIFKFFKV